MRYVCPSISDRKNSEKRYIFYKQKHCRYWKVKSKMMLRCVQRCLAKQSTVLTLQRETGHHSYFIRSNGYQYMKEKMHSSSPITAKAEEREAPERAEQPIAEGKRVPKRPQPQSHDRPHQEHDYCQRVVATSTTFFKQTRQDQIFTPS